MNFVFLFFLGLNIVADVSDNKEPDVNQNATETVFFKGEMNSSFLKGQYSVEYKISSFSEFLEKTYNLVKNERDARIAMQKYSFVGICVFIICLFLTFHIIEKNKNTV